MFDFEALTRVQNGLLSIAFCILLLVGVFIGMSGIGKNWKINKFLHKYGIWIAIPIIIIGLILNFI